MEIAIVDQVSDPTAYEQCLALCKILTRNRREESISVLTAMLGELPSLQQQGQRGKQIISTLIDILLFLPTALGVEELPLAHVQSIMTMLFEKKEHKQIARLIRKYFGHFDSKTQRNCLDLLVQTVSTPITDLSMSEVVYESALALKTCLS
jgi:hypothetical protein